MEEKHCPQHVSEIEKEINSNLRKIFTRAEEVATREDTMTQLNEDSHICIPVEGSEIIIVGGEHNPSKVGFIQYNSQDDSYYDEPESGMPINRYIKVFTEHNGAVVLETNMSQTGGKVLLARRRPGNDFRIIGDNESVREERRLKAKGTTALLLHALDKLQ